VKRGAAIAALLLLTPTFQAAQPSGRVIEVQRGAAAAATFETLWADYSKFDRANDDNAAKVLGEITRLRVERNIGGLESMALALVAKGIDKLRNGELEAAERYFGGALSLDPRLPDAYLGMAQVQARRGPVGMVGRDQAHGLRRSWRASTPRTAAIGCWRS
jgi:hypothetical protein